MKFYKFFILALCFSVTQIGFAQSGKKPNGNRAHQQIARYHSNLVELMNHHVDVINDNAQTPDLAEAVFKGQSIGSPDFKEIPEIDADMRAALNPPAALGADQANLRNQVNVMHSAYLEYVKQLNNLASYMEYDKAGKTKYEADGGKAGLVMVEKLRVARSQFSSAHRALSDSSEKMMESLFARSVEKDPLKQYLVNMNSDLNQAKKLLRLLSRVKENATNQMQIQSLLSGLQSAHKTHEQADEKLLTKHFSNGVQLYGDFYSGLSSMLEDATRFNNKVKADHIESDDYNTLVQTYNGMIDAFNGFSDR